MTVTATGSLGSAGGSAGGSIDFAALRERFPTLVERAYFATHGFGPLLRNH